MRPFLRCSPPRRPRLTECLLLNECRRRPPCQTEWLPCLCGRGVPGGRSAQSLSTLRVASKMRLHAVLFCLVFQFPSGLPYPQGKCFYIFYFYRFLLCVSFGCRFKQTIPGRERYFSLCRTFCWYWFFFLHTKLYSVLIFDTFEILIFSYLFSTFE